MVKFSLRCLLRAPTLLSVYKQLESLLVEISDVIAVKKMEMRLHSRYCSSFLHPTPPSRPSQPPSQTFPTSFPRRQSLSKDFGVDHWPWRGCFPGKIKHHVGFIHMSGRTMKYYKRFRFISLDRLASFAVPIKALNDAIHQRVDSIGSD